MVIPGEVHHWQQRYRPHPEERGGDLAPYLQRTRVEFQGAEAPRQEQVRDGLHRAEEGRELPLFPERGERLPTGHGQDERRVPPDNAEQGRRSGRPGRPGLSRDLGGLPAAVGGAPTADVGGAACCTEDEARVAVDAGGAAAADAGDGG